MRRDQVGKNGCEPRSKQPRKNLDIAVGKSDRAQVGDVRKMTARFRNKRDEGTRAGRRSWASGQDRIEKEKENGGKGFCERLVPFIRNAIRARRAPGRKCLNRG